ncbi:hypothetical protein GQ42DRAFT_153435 [Ramicandelaber brevisporus]|nr:hypothetical protein GQ42DRAFT_153435 [Ramicandelaber brevisporus]
MPNTVQYGSFHADNFGSTQPLLSDDADGYSVGFAMTSSTTSAAINAYAVDSLANRVLPTAMIEHVPNPWNDSLIEGTSVQALRYVFMILLLAIGVAGLRQIILHITYNGCWPVRAQNGIYTAAMLFTVVNFVLLFVASSRVQTSERAQYTGPSRATEALLALAWSLLYGSYAVVLIAFRRVIYGAPDTHSAVGGRSYHRSRFWNFFGVITRLLRFCWRGVFGNRCFGSGRRRSGSRDQAMVRVSPPYAIREALFSWPILSANVYTCTSIAHVISAIYISQPRAFYRNWSSLDVSRALLAYRSTGFVLSVIAPVLFIAHSVQLAMYGRRLMMEARTLFSQAIMRRSMMRLAVLALLGCTCWSIRAIQHFCVFGLGFTSNVALDQVDVSLGPDVANTSGWGFHGAGNTSASAYTGLTFLSTFIGAVLALAAILCVKPGSRTTVRARKIARGGVNDAMLNDPWGVGGMGDMARAVSTAANRQLHDQRSELKSDSQTRPTSSHSREAPRYCRLSISTVNNNNNNSAPSTYDPSLTPSTIAAAATPSTVASGVPLIPYHHHHHHHHLSAHSLQQQQQQQQQQRYSIPLTIQQQDIHKQRLQAESKQAPGLVQLFRNLFGLTTSASENAGSRESAGYGVSTRSTSSGSNGSNADTLVARPGQVTSIAAASVAANAGIEGGLFGYHNHTRASSSATAGINNSNNNNTSNTAPPSRQHRVLDSMSSLSDVELKDVSIRRMPSNVSSIRDTMLSETGSRSTIGLASMSASTISLGSSAAQSTPRAVVSTSTRSATAMNPDGSATTPAVSISDATSAQQKETRNAVDVIVPPEIPPNPFLAAPYIQRAGRSDSHAPSIAPSVRSSIYGGRSFTGGAQNSAVVGADVSPLPTPGSLHRRGMSYQGTIPPEASPATASATRIQPQRSMTCDTTSISSKRSSRIIKGMSWQRDTVGTSAEAASNSTWSQMTTPVSSTPLVNADEPQRFILTLDVPDPYGVLQPTETLQFVKPSRGNGGGGGGDSSPGSSISARIRKGLRRARPVSDNFGGLSDLIASFGNGGGSGMAPDGSTGSPSTAGGGSASSRSRFSPASAFPFLNAIRRGSNTSVTSTTTGPVASAVQSQPLPTAALDTDSVLTSSSASASASTGMMMPAPMRRNYTAVDSVGYRPSLPTIMDSLSMEGVIRTESAGDKLDMASTSAAISTSATATAVGTMTEYPTIDAAIASQSLDPLGKSLDSFTNTIRPPVLSAIKAQSTPDPSIDESTSEFTPTFVSDDQPQQLQLPPRQPPPLTERRTSKLQPREPTQEPFTTMPLKGLDDRATMYLSTRLSKQEFMRRPSQIAATLSIYSTHAISELN